MQNACCIVIMCVCVGGGCTPPGALMHLLHVFLAIYEVPHSLSPPSHTTLLPDILPLLAMLSLRSYIQRLMVRARGYGGVTILC